MLIRKVHGIGRNVKLTSHLQPVLEMLEISEALHTHTHTPQRVPSRHKLGRSYFLYLSWKNFFSVYRHYSTIFLERRRKVMEKIMALPYMTLQLLETSCKLQSH